MSAEEKNEVTEQTSRPKAHASRAKKRPDRVPLSGSRDILTVHGRDPNFHYRWILDVDENGARIERYHDAGYEFVMSNEVSGVGHRRVAEATSEGSIVRKPAGNSGATSGTPQYLYLMKIPKEYYEEDKAARAEEIAQRERELFDFHKGDEGFYGDIKLSKR